MTELVIKTLNEKALKSKETLVHKINAEYKAENLDGANVRLVKKILKSKDMQNFKPSAWSKGLDVIYSWVQGEVEKVKLEESPENVKTMTKEFKKERISKSMIRKPSKPRVG